MKKLLICFLFLFSFEGQTSDLKAPTPVLQTLKSDNLIGATELKYFGFKVYDIDLWCEKPQFSYQEKFAIHIRYNMNFSREDLAKRSLEEITRLHNLRDSEQKDYFQKLLKIFANVKKGDEKVAIFIPQTGVEMFYNNQLIGKISDPKLARLFVDIWLDERGSFPHVTKKLLGK